MHKHTFAIYIYHSRVGFTSEGPPPAHEIGAKSRENFTRLHSKKIPEEMAEVCALFWIQIPVVSRTLIGLLELVPHWLESTMPIG